MIKQFKDIRRFKFSLFDNGSKVDEGSYPSIEAIDNRLKHLKRVKFK
jgi:hypothetical protein